MFSRIVVTLHVKMYDHTFFVYYVECLFLTFLDNGERNIMKLSESGIVSGSGVPRNFVRWGFNKFS